jgi:hypothetical protein
VADAALDTPVQIFPREFLGISAGIGTRRTVGIP